MNNFDSSKQIHNIEQALSQELEQDISVFLSVFPGEIMLSESTDQKIRTMISMISAKKPKFLGK